MASCENCQEHIPPNTTTCPNCGMQLDEQKKSTTGFQTRSSLKGKPPVFSTSCVTMFEVNGKNFVNCPNPPCKAKIPVRHPKKNAMTCPECGKKMTIERNLSFIDKLKSLFTTPKRDKHDHGPAEDPREPPSKRTENECGTCRSYITREATTCPTCGVMFED